MRASGVISFNVVLRLAKSGNSPRHGLYNVDVIVGLGSVLSDTPLYLPYPTTVNDYTSSPAIFSPFG